MTPEEIAQCATLAMALEVSATPKPGNIDREHNYPDTRYEHFLASAIATYPLIAEAAKQTKGFGKLLHDAIVESNNWQQGGNTHFGALTLLPLLTGRGLLWTVEAARDTFAALPALLLFGAVTALVYHWLHVFGRLLFDDDDDA